jgi:hypothetical protein
MRRALVVVALWGVVAGCASVRAALSDRWRWTLEEKPAAEDSAAGGVRVETSPGKDVVGLVIHNDGEGSVRVLWDDWSWVDQNGEAHRIIHKGVRLISKDAAQTPSIVPSGSMLRDTLVLADGVYFEEGKYGGWRYSPMLDPRLRDENEWSAYCDREVRLVMVFERAGVRIEVPRAWIIQCSRTEYWGK